MTCSKSICDQCDYRATQLGSCMKHQQPIPVCGICESFNDGSDIFGMHEKHQIRLDGICIICGRQVENNAATQKDGRLIFPRTTASETPKVFLLIIENVS